MSPTGPGSAPQCPRPGPRTGPGSAAAATRSSRQCADNVKARGDVARGVDLKLDPQLDPLGVGVLGTVQDADRQLQGEVLAQPEPCQGVSSAV